jgi:cell wall-associated NlpC family hydrolase
VRYVFHAFGYTAPRTAARYGRLKPKLSLSSAKRADVLVFKQKGTWHLGLVVGDNRFVHAPSRGQRVREEMVNAYWRERLVRVVRIIAD